MFHFTFSLLMEELQVVLRGLSPSTVMGKKEKNITKRHDISFNNKICKIFRYA